MFPAGGQQHPHWQDWPYATPTSMRNVDAECSARPLFSGYGERAPGWASSESKTMLLAKDLSKRLAYAKPETGPERSTDHTFWSWSLGGLPRRRIPDDSRTRRMAVCRGMNVLGIGSITEERLQARLGVTHFRLPPDYTESPGRDIQNANQHIPFVRFPLWHYCPRRGAMERLPLFGGRLKVPLSPRS